MAYSQLILKLFFVHLRDGCSLTVLIFRKKSNTVREPLGHATFSYSDECRTKKAFKYVAVFSCCGKVL